MSEPTANHHKFAKSVCVPLYIGHPLLLDGHSMQNENATATLVSFRRRKYAVTCRHVVLDAVKERPGAVPRFHLGQVVRPMPRLFRYVAPVASGVPVPEGAGASDDGTPDIAIADITNIWWNFERVGRTFIDLDAFIQPHWDKDQMCFAAGYLNEHKEEIDQQVVAKLVLVAAKLVRLPLEYEETFRFQSLLEESPNLFLSGTSGGPVFVPVDNTTLHPIGIVFDGLPGSKKTDMGEASIMGANFVTIGALRLTPETFENWLNRATVY